jgi:hypothetical protein|tara:strand:- start:1157 stop:2005 length:849 start_codon:yes stop_codon:yes gene_type:complete
MTNILKTVFLIVTNPIIEVKEHYSGLNRANQVGEALEEYVKDAFADTFDLTEFERMKRFNKVFSYLGNQNNPPDMMIKGGDAIEIKKLNQPGGILQLNSSYPKSRLHVDNPMIKKSCKTCEDWDVKDFIYVVGHLQKNSLNTLWMVYGDCFVADKEVYENIKKEVTAGINSIPGIDFGETVEPGRINKVDPLGYTDLRLRGMWHIKHPKNIFGYLDVYSKTSDFQLICIMRTDKYFSFPEENRNLLGNLDVSGFEIIDKKISNPNNPAELVDCKAIIFRIKS